MNNSQQFPRVEIIPQVISDSSKDTSKANQNCLKKTVCYKHTCGDDEQSRVTFEDANETSSKTLLLPVPQLRQIAKDSLAAMNETNGNSLMPAFVGPTSASSPIVGRKRSSNRSSDGPVCKVSKRNSSKCSASPQYLPKQITTDTISPTNSSVNIMDVEQDVKALNHSISNGKNLLNSRDNSINLIKDHAMEGTAVTGRLSCAASDTSLIHDKNNIVEAASECGSSKTNVTLAEVQDATAGKTEINDAVSVIASPAKFVAPNSLILETTSINNLKHPDSPVIPPQRSTRTKTKKAAAASQVQTILSPPAEVPEKPVRTTRSKKRQVDLNDSISSLSSDRCSVASTGRSTRTKKRKFDAQQTEICKKQTMFKSSISQQNPRYLISDSKHEDDVDSSKRRLSSASTISACSVTTTGAINDGMQSDAVPSSHQKSVGKVQSRVTDQPIRLDSNPLSPLLAAGIEAAQCSKFSSEEDLQVRNEDREEVFDKTDEQLEHEEEEEEPEVMVVDPPRRITRSKVKLQQQQELSVPLKTSPKQRKHLQKQISAGVTAVTAVMSKAKKHKLNDSKQTAGKFSPRPFGGQTNVRQLAAAYSEHVSCATSSTNSTPALNRARNPAASTLSRVSSMSRIGPASSVTPLTNKWTKTNFAGGSTDSHHYRTMTRVSAELF